MQATQELGAWLVEITVVVLAVLTTLDTACTMVVAMAAAAVVVMVTVVTTPMLCLSTCLIQTAAVMVAHPCIIAVLAGEAKPLHRFVCVTTRTMLRVYPRELTSKNRSSRKRKKRCRGYRRMHKQAAVVTITRIVLLLTAKLLSLSLSLL
jgi:hypothetical protein